MTNTGGEAAAGLFAGLIGFGFVSLFFLFFFALSIAILVLWIWMLIDAAKRDYEGENDKTLWILVIVLGGWIGALIYYFVVKRKDSESISQSNPIPPSQPAQ